MKLKIILLAALLFIINIPFNASASENETASFNNSFASKSLVNSTQRKAINGYLKKNDLKIYFPDKDVFEQIIGEEYNESLLKFDDANATFYYKKSGISRYDLMHNYKFVSDMVKNAETIYKIPVYYDDLYFGYSRLIIYSDGSFGDLIIYQQRSSTIRNGIEISGQEEIDYVNKMTNMSNAAIESAIIEYGLNLNKIKYYTIECVNPLRPIKLLVEDDVMYPFEFTNYPSSSGDGEYKLKIYTVDEYMKILEAEKAMYEEEARTGNYTAGGGGSIQKSNIEIAKDFIPYIAIGASVLLLGVAGYLSVKKVKKSRR